MVIFENIFNFDILTWFSGENVREAVWVGVGVGVGEGCFYQTLMYNPSEISLASWLIQPEDVWSST